MERTPRRLLMLAPSAAIGGVDQFNLNLVDQLAGRCWETTLALLLPGDHAWLPRFRERVSDVVALGDVPPREYPTALTDLVRSRRPDAILLTNAQIGYAALPCLRLAA